MELILSKKRSVEGVTLTELLVASVLVGVVMAGVVSVDMGLRRIDKQLTEEATAAIELVPVMNHILNNALKAEGDSGDIGFCIDGHATLGPCVASTDPYTFCVRQTSSGDFFCYSQYDTKLYACIETDWADCSQSDFHIGNISATSFSSATNPDYDNTTNIFTIEIAPVDSALVDPMSSAIAPPGHRN